VLRSVVRYLAALRFKEILLLQGPPLLGALAALRHPTATHIAPLAFLVAANLCLMAHVFAINDWANATADLGDITRGLDTFARRAVSLKELLALAQTLLGASLVFASRLGATAMLLTLGIAALSALYSLPLFDWKGRPLLNSTAHLGGGVLHFLLGYSLGNVLDRRGIFMACFCAITFAAGHLIQELRDYESDGRNGIMTNARFFGPRRTFVASLIGFTLSHLILFALALRGDLPRPLAALIVLYPLQLHWSLRVLADGLTRDSICRLQVRYRALYACIGAAVAMALWLE
jgi:4-hydroxybenzoate polyprenyltransferase